MHPVTQFSGDVVFRRWQENSNYQATCNAAGQTFGYALGILAFEFQDVEKNLGLDV